MIESFFRSLERESVAYLLISGQATVLYGAAAFSEDVDLWVKPGKANVAAFLRALCTMEARYYKFTPPLTPDLMLRGHGFHYVIPDDPDLYLDVMGQPPRVPDFDECGPETRTIPTPWGNIPTIGIVHLAALKTTQRLSDYPIIGQLALRYLQEKDVPSPSDYRWAIDNTHTLDDIMRLFAEHPSAASACSAIEPLHALARELAQSESPRPTTSDAAEQWLTDRMLRLRRADRAYWQAIIQELRDMRAGSALMPVGSPVQASEPPFRRETEGN